MWGSPQSLTYRFNNLIDSQNSEDSFTYYYQLIIKDSTWEHPNRRDAEGGDVGVGTEHAGSLWEDHPPSTSLNSPPWNLNESCLLGVFNGGFIT